MTAEELHRRIVAIYPDMNISTVYRNLERLLDLRLVAVTDLGGGHVCYEALDGARHHHLVCRRCGQIINLDDSIVEDLRSQVEHAYNFKTEIDHLAIWGVCVACQGLPAPVSPRHPAQQPGSAQTAGAGSTSTS